MKSARAKFPERRRKEACKRSILTASLRGAATRIQMTWTAKLLIKVPGLCGPPPG